MEPKETKSERQWYQKKRWIISLLVGAVFIIGLAGTSGTAPAQIQSASQMAAAQAAIANKAYVPTEPIAQPTHQTDALSNDTYYTNVSGNSVHSPAYADSAPAGASAQCGDGTYSFSQHRSGTCSHHSGVASWL